jgi:TolA-binding protein
VDFAAQLEMGLAKFVFDKQKYADAGERYQSIYNHYPDAGVAPEASYWEGVAAYKATSDPAPLREAAKRLQQKYPDNEWARKASVWAG